MQKTNSQLETATFGAGCFWGVEETFRRLKGVKSTMVGYSGGNFKNPTYQDVCSKLTGHAEVVQLEYDPNEITYEEILNTFWGCHNPTSGNRQGPDVGSQYRSAIYCHTSEQTKIAQKSKEDLEKSGKLSRPITTEIKPAETFYKAEEYHQQYLAKKGLDSCHI